jgi:chromosome segregation ATPase
MSDDLDQLAKVGTGGVAGIGIAAAIIKFLFGSALVELRDSLKALENYTKQIAETQQKHEVAFASLESEVASFQKVYERDLNRTDDLVGRLAKLEQTVDALHRRIDERTHQS